MCKRSSFNGLPLGSRICPNFVSDLEEKAILDIKNKNYSKVILSRKINISESINMLKSYFLGMRFNNPARSYLYDVNGMELFGFSPETIVQVNNNNKVITFPLAGTRKNEESLKKELLTDIKEVGEHAVSVKLALEELANVCKLSTIKVDKFMNIYERGSVQHLGSEVSGELINNNYWNALLALYPAVTAAGIPKKESIEAIEKYEDTPRDLYSGGMFLINHEIGFDVALILRTVFQDKKETYLRAGIVEKSKPDRELEETREKLKSVIESLSL
ncbi:salicylate synthase [Staphylococcus capitis]